MSPAGAPEDENALLGFESETPKSTPEVRHVDRAVPKLADAPAPLTPAAAASSAPAPAIPEVAPAPTGPRRAANAAPLVQTPSPAPEAVAPAKSLPVSHVDVAPKPSLPPLPSVFSAGDTGHRAEPVSEPNSPVSLAALKARGLALRWFEIVAVVQGLCSALIEAQQETMLVSMDTVFLRADGRIFAAHAEIRDDETAVKAVGGVLDQIGGTELPAPLKFLASKATSSPPAYGTLAEFSSALSYYERPNRLELLQGVYEAWKALPAPAVSAQPAVPPPAKKQSAASRKQPVGQRSWEPHQGRGMVMAAGLALVLCTVAFWALSVRSRNENSAAVNPGAATGADQILDVRSDQTVETAALIGSAGSRPHAPRVASTGPGGWTGAPVEPVSGRSGARAAGTREVAAAATASPAIRNEYSRENFTDIATYSAADRDVVPPLAVYPRLPSLGPEDRGVSAFEIVVTDDGSVESVRAATAPGSVGQAMQITGILSAAKSWRFQPASKNGHAVRYRLLVWLQLH
jgi:hypothetical protein